MPVFWLDSQTLASFYMLVAGQDTRTHFFDIPALTEVWGSIYRQLLDVCIVLDTGDIDSIYISMSVGIKKILSSC